MKSNLAFLQEAVETAVNSPPTSRTELTIVGGISLQREVPVPANRYSGYKSDAEEMRSYLRTRGVEPLAVLPSDWWEKMYREANLVHVVGHQQELTLDVSSLADVAGVLGVAGVIAGSLAGGTALYLLADWNWFGGWFVSLLGLAMTTAVLFPLTFRLLARLSIRCFGGRDAALLSALESGRTGKRKKQVGFGLPSPTTEVGEAILKFLPNDLQIVAVPSAFRLDRSLDLLVRDGMMAQLGEAREAFLAEMQDPIVYIQRGRATAVIAQWGDFPLERELIERVISRPL